jgi:transposase
MKKKQRKSYTAAFKVKIALEAIKGQRTINEIATHYGVHPNMVTQWKKQAIESLPDVFSIRRERDAQGEEALKAELYRVRRLLRLMGLEAIYPKPQLSLASPGHQIYPYLLRGVKVHMQRPSAYSRGEASISYPIYSSAIS